MYLCHFSKIFQIFKNIPIFSKVQYSKFFQNIPNFSKVFHFFPIIFQLSPKIFQVFPKYSKFFPTIPIFSKYSKYNRGKNYHRDNCHDFQFQINPSLIFTGKKMSILTQILLEYQMEDLRLSVSKCGSFLILQLVVESGLFSYISN